jgi:hypothetical protein
LRAVLRPGDELVVKDTLPLNPLIGMIATVSELGTPTFAFRKVGLTDIEKSTILTDTVTEWTRPLLVDPVTVAV